MTDMPQPSPSSIVTLFVFSVTVMVFFTSSASNRIEKFGSPNRKIIASLSLVASYSLLFWIAWLLVVSDQMDGYPALYKTMQLVFAAFIVPGFILLSDQLEKIEKYRQHPDYSLFWTIVGCAFASFIYLGIIFASPASV